MMLETVSLASKVDGREGRREECKDVYNGKLMGAVYIRDEIKDEKKK